MSSYEVENDLYVMKVEEVDTGTQIATVKTYHDMLTWIVLSASQNLPTIGSSVTVTATLQNYDGSLASNNPTQLTFSVNGITQATNMLNGKASITVTSSVAGIVEVTCSGDNVKQSQLGVAFQ